MPLAQGQPPEDPAQNFGMWLFDSNMTAAYGLNPSSFVDSGLESTFNNALSYDRESSRASRSQFDAVSSPGLSLPGPSADEHTEDNFSDARRAQLVEYFWQFYRVDSRRQEAVSHIMREADDGDIHALRKDVLKDFLREYWTSLALRMPIIHQPTFSINGCPTLLLVAMMALGAASISLREPNFIDYTAFSDMLIEGVRWEILRSEDATPPVALWVAQALLLVELYEKMYSTRRLHERAHIHHSITLNLLRRGSPLIGRSGSETPPPGSPRMAGIFGNTGGGGNGPVADGNRSWWLRWAETEAMHRVVFTAFMMDIIHACMFGHIADMQPHEIRLPLPCDDSVWSATSPDQCRKMEATIRMYGVEPVTFLDGLRKTVHTQDVKSHPFARMIIMSGLLNVAWHIRRNSLHLNWLDGGASAALSSSSSTAVTVGGKGDPAHFKMVLKAFDTWKASFDQATSSGLAPVGANGPLASASLLYHLAYVSLRVDMIDCQVYAGVRRLLGRKVSARDYQNAVGRIKIWARDDATRQAILHAFKLLHSVLDTRRPGGGGNLLGGPYARGRVYSVREDPDPHRPWIMYFATISIWAFVRVYPVRHVPTPQPQPAASVPNRSVGAGTSTGRLSQFQDTKLLESTVEYLAGVARLQELTVADAEGLGNGVARLLETMQKLLGEARSELLLEAKDRLQICREVLYSSTG
ncbi:hypothetical protein TD95_003688 [Thielaviopsis punctulata]|uniref:Xylanolytic transcriptional activator regulatory domain-containing protein n=1 Tax=Thielaviopsis punctulata TaxID=72032 RepID=A0A0F4Z9I2_9PEZI|nr:hypothetical protein TD95_003688 [Thielaviopsis punctulata]